MAGAWLLRLLAIAFGLAAWTAVAHASTVATPTFSPAAGTFSNAQTVTIASTTSGASIRYTTDGSTPSSTAGTVYSSPVSISKTTTLKAIAYKSGMTTSAVASATYTLVVAAPTFSPAAGTLNNAQTVTITSATNNATIRYTTDGSTPSTTAGTIYSAPVSISATITLKAIAYETGFTSSAVTSGTYTMTAATPSFSPAAGTYTSVQVVTISSATSGATMRYTTDGSTPSTTAGTVYSNPVTISANTTLKAIAYESGFANSSVTSGTYTMVAAAPTFTPAAGSLNNPTSVTISSTTSGASIRYTTDGSTPTSTSGTVYSNPVTISANTTLKAIAYKTGFTSSGVTSGTYTMVAAAPTFSPAAGSLNNPTSVTISSATTGASIRYTTDGSTPSSTAGTVYSNPVTISANTTLKAIAYKTGFTSSGVTSGTYTMVAAVPTFSPAAGSLNNSTSVTISSATSGASIRYTTDGSTPSSTAGTVYSNPVTISANTTLKAIAYKSGFTSSGVTSGTYTMVAALPTFSPAAGTFNSAQTVTITSVTSGASIRYTTDGSTPSSTSGTVYSNPITISATTTLNAIAYKSGFTSSAVTSGVYTILLPAAAPAFNPGGGTYTSTQSVTITSTTGSATIRYTTDGSSPTETNGTVYASPVGISVTTTLKAIAYKTGFSDSAITSAVYTITPPAAAPNFSPGGGTYASPQNVTITSTTGGATIRYTTNGSTPTETNGTVYNTPVTISSTATLQAIAYESGFADSSVTSATYTIIPPPSAPVFNPPAGTYTSAQTVTITSSGAISIYYTTDGSTPTTASLLYSSPILISATTTLKAAGANSSGLGSITTGIYTVNLPPAAAPVFSPAGGTYINPQTVTLTSTTGGATIRYTTDGSTPTETAGTVYLGPVTISSTTTLQAIAYETGFADSPVASATYTINPPISLDGLRIWLRADDPNITLNNGQISTWPDDSGSVPANNATQASVSYQPTLVTGQLNQLPVVHFVAGSNKQFLGWSTNPMNGATAGEVFVVVRSTGASGILWFWGQGGGSWYPHPTGSVWDGWGTTSWNNTGQPPVDLTQYNLYNISSSSTEWTQRFNGLVNYDQLSNQVGFVSGPALGYGGFTGDIAEFIVYNQVLTPAQRDAVGTYLGTKYNLYPPPTVPTNVKATALSSDQISLQWLEPARNDHINYLIERSTDGVTFAPVATVPDALSFIDTASTGLQAGKSYWYEVQAQGYTGMSAPSTPATTTTLPSRMGTDLPMTSSSGLCLWLKADTGLSAGSGIKKWPDQSGSGNDAVVPPAPATEPTLLTFATDPTVPNGRPMVHFDGSSSCLSLPGSFMSGATAGELFVVLRAASIIPSADARVLNVGGNGGTSYPASSGLIDDGFGSTAAQVMSPQGADITQTQIYNASASGSGWSAWLDGQSLYTTPTNSPNFTGSYGLPVIGADHSGAGVLANWFAGDVAEILVYNRTLSAAERATVDAYLADKYFQPAVAPVFSLAAGTYANAQAVAITSATSGATIRYTTDGSPPTEANGTVYSGPVNIAATTTLQAVAYASGLADSPVTSAVYTLQAAAPAFNPIAGTYANAQAVTITSATNGATMRYTTDGSTPTETTGTIYVGPISVTAPTTIKAIAYETGFVDSPVAGAAYTLQAAAPIFNPAAGTFANAQTVAITSATTGAAIRYTTDGSTPTETTGTLYSGPVSISAPATLKAIAYQSNFADSPVASAAYTLQAAAPVFSAGAGHTVTIATTTTGAAIRYTTDGSTPTEINGTLYSGPVNITSPTTLRAVAYRSGFTDSPVTSAAIGVPTITITTPANGSTINN